MIRPGREMVTPGRSTRKFSDPAEFLGSGGGIFEEEGRMKEDPGTDGRNRDD